MHHFPPGVDVPFLAAWIERESGGRYDAKSRLGEVGYFQLHPAEIADIFGKNQVPSVTNAILSDPGASMRAGGALLQHYDRAITYPKHARSDLYHGMLKLMHSSRPRGIKWQAAVKNPRTFNEFLAETRRLKASSLGNTLPPLPSCSAWQLLQRRNAFRLPGDALALGPQEPFLAQTQSTTALQTAALIAAQSALGAAADFPGVSFIAPLADSHVFSGWGRPRPARNGVHEGIDLTAAIGTPVFAVEDGAVARVGTESNAGLFVVIHHAGGWTSRYMHLSRADVKAGDAVRRGQQIALSGSSGISSSGPHLHFDLLLERGRLPNYIALFGEPLGGFGHERSDGVGVPAEPLIPVDSYSDRTIIDAKAHGIPLFTPVRRPIPVGAALAAGVGLLAHGAVIIYTRTK